MWSKVKRQWKTRPIQIDINKMFPRSKSDKKINIDWQGSSWTDSYGNLNNTFHYILEKWDDSLKMFRKQTKFSERAESIMSQAFSDSLNVLIPNLAKAYLVARSGKDSSMTMGLDYSDTVFIYSFECFNGTLENRFGDILKKSGYRKLAELTYNRTITDMKSKGSLPNDKRNIFYHILFAVEEEKIYLYAYSDYYEFTYQDEKTVKYDKATDVARKDPNNATMTIGQLSEPSISELTVYLRNHIEKCKLYVKPPEKAPMMNLLLDQLNFNQIVAAAENKITKGCADNQPHSIILLGQGIGEKHFVHISTLPWDRLQNRAFFARAGGYEEFLMQTAVDVIEKADPSSVIGGRNLQDQGYFHIIIEHVKNKIAMVHLSCLPLSLGYEFLSAKRGNAASVDNVKSPFPLFWANDFLRVPS